MTTDERTQLQDKILALVAGWEQSCAYDFIDDLLNEMTDEAVEKVAKQQGVDL